MKAIIVGGGIGGLTTALMLHARGIEVELYEQAETVRELGVGINTLPHAIAELAELGLLDALDGVAIRTHELIYANRFGQEVWREKRGTHAGFPVPQFSIHRGRLQSVILAAVRDRLGPAPVRTGSRLAAFTSDEGGVTARFFDRNDRYLCSARGDVLIAADGIHSAVRAQLFPGEGPPAWNGRILWRGATDWPVFLDGESMVIAGGMSAKLVVYPIAEGSTPERRLTNWAIVAA
ncbi:MAG: flavin-dependent oxidoreductase, partial [Enterovirga sp.]|nr:flavin-dependent oxidoreductase [Enterovirga sp.]